ncbi:MAG: BamA/TamA family outer membrane protein [Gammaproteobacteria bacterium]
MKNRFLLIILLIFISPGPLWATIEQDLREQADRANEVKVAAGKQGTWLPVPIPVSNPTIGSGLQAALLYLHPHESEDTTVPHATSGIVGMYTDSDSWLAGGFHDGSWKEDLYRFRVIAGTGEFNLDFYGIGEGSSLRDNPVPYALSSDILLTQLLRRFPGSDNWYFGMRYMAINSNVVFDFSTSIPGLPPISDDMTTSSLGFMLSYDSRDDNYYPTSGSHAEVVWMRDSEAWGSDFEFNKASSYYNYYYPFSAKDTLALRATLSDSDGDIPFYLLPHLNLRGFPTGRYKDNSSISGHVEWRRKFHPRWGFIVFYEAGTIADTVNTLFEFETITSYGGGLRWQVSKDNKLHLGIDVGYSDGESAVYVQVGEKF